MWGEGGSIRFHFEFISSSLRLHFNFTSSSLRFHFDSHLMSSRLHFDFTSDSRRFHFDFTSNSLRLSFDLTSIPHGENENKRSVTQWKRENSVGPKGNQTARTNETKRFPGRRHPPTSDDVFSFKCNQRI